MIYGMLNLRGSECSDCFSFRGTWEYVTSNVVYTYIYRYLFHLCNHTEGVCVYLVLLFFLLP